MNELKQAILKTIIYFDIFNYPLTLMEIWKWLYKPDKAYSLSDIMEELDNNKGAEIEMESGFYFLKNRREIVETRLKRYGYAISKYRRAIRFIKIFRHIPFIKMISVCNSLAYSNCAPEGDIDLFIIAEKNRLWLARLLTVGLLKLLRVRPTVISKRDAIDTNFFLSEANLDLSEHKEGKEGICLSYWINQIVPIFNPCGIYEKFQIANNWIKNSLPNSYNYETNEKRRVELDWFNKILRRGMRLFLDYDILEKLSKKCQLIIMPVELKQIMNQDNRVAVNDNILKFHRQDRRIEYLKKFKEKLIYYGIF